MSKYWKLTVITALVGGAVAYLLPVRYVSSAVLQVKLVVVEGLNHADRRFTKVQQDVLSRASLAETTQRPGLDLYRYERARIPMEDIIQTMRERDIRIERLEKGGTRYRVSFTYPDREVAPLVVRDLVRKFGQQNSLIDGTIEAVEMPQGPGQSTRNLPVTVGIGLGVGTLCGPLILLLRRRPWQWHLMLFGFAIAGGLAAAMAAFYSETPYPDDVTLTALGVGAGGATGLFLLRRGGGRRGKAEVAMAAIAAGAIVAGLISFALPVQFVSKSVMRLYSVAAAVAPAPDRRADASERIAQITEIALCRSTLAALIQRPALDLYRAERSRMPMEDVVKAMGTRDLHIAPLVPGDAEAGLEISFRYGDRYKAQAVVREMVNRFMVENSNLERRTGGGPNVPGSLMMEVIEPATMPERASAPDRLLITGAGGAIALVAVLLTMFIRRQPPPRRVAMLRFGLGAGAAGALVAAAIALAIPSRYVSTAALRIVQPLTGVRDKSIVEDLHMRIANVVSAQGLSDLIQRPSLDLYPKERAKRPVREVIQQIRARDLRIETVIVSGSGMTESLRISFEYPDRVKAQAMVRAVVSLLVEGTVAHPGAEAPAKSTVGVSTPLAAAVRSMRAEPVRQPRVPSPREALAGTGARERLEPVVTFAYVEVLDPPSMPDAPALPNRMSIVTLGLITGLLLGPMAALLRRPARPTAAVV